MGLMRNKFLAAYKQAGMKPPKASGKTRRAEPHANNRDDPSVAHGSSKLANKTQTQKTKTSSNKTGRATTINSRRSKTAWGADKRKTRKALPKPNVSTQTKTTPPSVAKPTGVSARPPFSVTLVGTPQYQFCHDKHSSARLIERSTELGVRMQLSPGSVGDAHDITLGFDFGTSAVKVVVGDATIEKYFAVPFRDGVGINQYLLPCRVWETTDTWSSKYSLTGGDTAYRDLKLSLLAEPDEKANLIRAIAFFALIFQQVRAWLFIEHAEIYRAADIYWGIAIGLPSESHIDNALTPIFERAVRVAWKMSVEREIHAAAISTILEESNTPEIDAEISVVPEIAAQIYGFVSSPSSSFDKQRSNRYAIVDIGAGTVDSSIFEVKQKQGLWNFTYYTAVVEPNGVANLHAHRIGWWTKVLSGHDPANIAIKDLLADKYSTDTESAIPQSYKDYIANVVVEFNDKKQPDPDNDFFSRRLLRQVKGRTIWRCWNKELLGQNEIEGMPIFVCGGGARMSFYSKLVDVTPRTEGTTWISLVPWQLKRPTNLI